MAGRVCDSSGNCCIMGNGDFAVVPSSLLDPAEALHFLPSCSVCASEPQLVIHSLTDSLSLVADASSWPSSCSCHEVEPLLVSCLKATSDSLHATLHDDRLYVAVLKNNALAFVNCFSALCREDYLYFLLAACRSTELDPQKHTLFIHGTLDKSFLINYFTRCE